MGRAPPFPLSSGEHPLAFNHCSPPHHHSYLLGSHTNQSFRSESDSSSNNFPSMASTSEPSNMHQLQPSPTNLHQLSPEDSVPLATQSSYVSVYQPQPLTPQAGSGVFEHSLDVFSSASSELRSLTADFSFHPSFGSEGLREDDSSVHSSFAFRSQNLRPDSPYSEGESVATSQLDSGQGMAKPRKPRGRRVATAETLDCSVFTSGKKLFICNEPDCGKVFKRAEHLSRHHRMHSGERPYTCSECDRSFSRSDNLSAHISRVRILQYLLIFHRHTRTLAKSLPRDVTVRLK